MSREERLNLLKQIEKDIHVCSIESTLLDDAKSCAIHSVIDELEQGPVLNKIRAEIKELQKDYHEYGWVYDDVLEIIDKYREGSDKFCANCTMTNL